ncbi:MAG: protein phosphatase 2C domain-containing protein [Chitinophagales bacterium]
MSKDNFYILSDIGGRAENQDFVLTQATEFGFAMIVCDGMGGANGGRLASETAAITIADFFNSHQLDSYEDERLYFLNLVESAIKKANQKVYDLSQSKPELHGMGTTACVVLLRRNKAYFGHVGDSRIYHINGKQFRHTEDHSRVFEMYKNDILSLEQARNHPESNIITRALGIKSDVQGNYEEVSVNIGDRLILCTDGIWGIYPEKTLIKFFTAKDSLQQICERLIDEINKKCNEEGKKHDNLSIGIIEVTDIKVASNDGQNEIIIEEIQNTNTPNLNLDTNKYKRNFTSSYILLAILMLALIALLLFAAGVFSYG